MHVPRRRWVAMLVATLVLVGAAAAEIGPDPAPPPPGTPRFDIILKGYLGNPKPPGTVAPYQSLLTAPYFRTLTSGAEWIDGGRTGYRCAWMFLDTPDGDRIGRVTFSGGYLTGTVTQIIDKWMIEDFAWYDGTPTGGVDETRDCPQFTGQGDWFGPPERPTLRFYEVASGDVLEVRSYLNTVFGPNVTAHLHSNDLTDRTVVPIFSEPHTVYQRVIIQVLLKGQEAINVYYEVLDPAYAIDVTPLVVVPTTADLRLAA